MDILLSNTLVARVLMALHYYISYFLCVLFCLCGVYSYLRGFVRLLHSAPTANTEECIEDMFAGVAFGTIALVICLLDVYAIFLLLAILVFLGVVMLTSNDINVIRHKLEPQVLP
jgi:hypothetical protein